MRFLSAEFIYRPRPDDPRTRAVFDHGFTSRVSRLQAADTLLLLADSPDSLNSLTPLLPAAPQIVTRIVNPTLHPTPNSETPHGFGWESPESWQQVTMTDRWARIIAALEVAADASPETSLLMPANDAVWGDGLLAYLARLSLTHARNGLPAAVSPTTYWQHSPVPEASIPPEIITLTNTVFGRDLLFPLKVWRDQVQGFWGKMSLMPAPLAAKLLPKLDTETLEDDIVIDSAIRKLGYGVRAMPILNPRVYRQALPVFDQAQLHVVIRRTLHYSLNITSNRLPVGGSTLNFPLGWGGRLRMLVSPRFRRYNPLAEALIREESEQIRRTLDQFGASWVDWGHYRVVVRIGEAACEIWKRTSTLL